MKLNYILSEQDYIDFNIYHMKTSKTMIRSVMIQRLMGPVVFTIFAYLAYRISNISLLYWSVIFLIASILWFLYYPKSLEKKLKKHIYKLLSEDENRGLLGNQKLEMYDEELTVTNETGSSKVNYSVFNRIDYTEKHIFAFNSSVSAYIIPLTAFENETKMKKFYDEFKTLIEKSREKE